MATYNKLMVVEALTDFRKATKVVSLPIPEPGPGQVLVENHFAGVNATDIINSAAIFTNNKVPFDIGYESLGKVEAIGEGVVNFMVGQPVMSLAGAGFAEYVVNTY